MYCFSPEHSPLTELVQRTSNWTLDEKIKSVRRGLEIFRVEERMERRDFPFWELTLLDLVWMESSNTNLFASVINYEEGRPSLTLCSFAGPFSILSVKKVPYALLQALSLSSPLRSFSELKSYSQALFLAVLSFHSSATFENAITCPSIHLSRMDFLGPVVQIILFFWAPVSQQIGYLKHLNNNVETLKKETEELQDKRHQIQADVDDAISVAISVGKTRVLQVDNWLLDVTIMEAQVDSLRSEFEQPRTCLNGCCTNHFSCYKLGKRVVKKLKDVKNLKAKGVFDKVGESPRRPRVLEMKTSLPRVQKSTADETMEEIWQCLHDEENGLVGVYGMGGIGKTTLMKAIKNRFIGTNDFNAVIWVIVSKDLNLGLIQEQIGNALDMKFHRNEENRNRLFSRLKNVRYLLILDDLWKAFSLDRVGIPKPDKQNRCKIAMTTRSIEVYIRPVVEKVVEECSGLPLAIKTVGRAMYGKDKKEVWENALRALKRSSPEVSDYDIEIDKLVRYWAMEEGFIENVNNLEEASNKGHDILERIKDACLLEEGSHRNKCVRMHDLLRDLAIWIASPSSSIEGSKFLVKAGEGLMQPPEEKMWRGVLRISLMRNKTKDLEITPDCPNLVSLFLNQNNQLCTIHSNFFELMPKLQILDLSDTGIESLPMSSLQLVNLCGLILRFCRALGEVPPLGELKELQILDLSYSGLKNFPQGIESLVKLRRLDISETSFTAIPELLSVRL
ncbi:disease resistance protein SUMM2-like [Magnolia sinica]|uniref:disease resistance protein SUMM2-like n=1 Tax=Magnolia sinica TaxID=86752 RepID=UPI0026580DA0|nr:disease resistance protein SUMM2-like [Magnolia sinica]